MDFTLTEEQQQLRRSVREFAEGEILPHVMEWDEASHFPMEIIPKLGEMGLLGVIFPRNTAERGWGTSSTSLRLKSWREWTGRWA